MPEPDMPVNENFVIDLDKGPNVESSLVRTLSNGLTIEDLSMGEADGKVATPGRKVKVHYTGMLRENGQVFDSNIGKTPYRFRLGDKQIIDGWNIGVEVMAVREVEKTYRQTHGWFMRSNWLASGDDFAWLFCYILPSKEDDSGRE
nr:peptidyl-prolyl cis-trans isomerase FKBP43 [Ipomoea batatas]